MRVLTAVLGEYVRAYDARILEVPGLLARLPHGGPGGDHPVLGLLGAHSVADYRSMPLHPRYPPTHRLRVRGPVWLLLRPPSPRETASLPALGGRRRRARHRRRSSSLSVAVRVVQSAARHRERRARARTTHPARSKRRSQCGPRRGHSHFYMSITALSRCPSPYLTAFDVDYLVCRCIAARQHDAGRVLMRCPTVPPFARS